MNVGRIVAATALVAVLAIGGATAEADKHSRGVKTKVRIDKVTTPGSDHTFVFKGRVTSKNEKCLGKREVEIFRDDTLITRGDVPPGPVASGKSKNSGKFALDTDTDLLATTEYRAVAFPRKHAGVKCKVGISKPFLLD